MKRRLTSHLAIALALAAIGSAEFAEARSPYADWTFESILPDPPRPERFQLSNGMIVHFLRSTEIPVISLTAIIGAGECGVTAEKTGLGSITGEVLRTGGAAEMSPDELDQELEYYGMTMQSSVGTESGNLSLRCRAQDFERGLMLFASALTEPRFDEQRLQLALANAVEEVRRENDSPASIVRREFVRLIYGEHPYGRSPSKITLTNITRDDVLQFYSQYYYPPNVILAVSGDIELKRLKSLLELALGKWNKKGTHRVVAPPVEGESLTGVYQISRDITQTNIRFGHLGIARQNPDRHALQVMNHILGSGGFTSRMMGTVRSDSGFAYSVGTYMTESDERGVFGAYCQTKSETTSRALGLMIHVIKDFLEHGPTEEEVKTARESILNSEVFKFVTPRQIVERFAFLEYEHWPPEQFRLDLEAIERVSVEDVARVAREYLHPDRITILAVGPIDRFDAPLSQFGPTKTISLSDSQ